MNSIRKSNEGIVSELFEGPDDTIAATLLIKGEILKAYFDEWGARLEWQGEDENVFRRVVAALEDGIVKLLRDSPQGDKQSFYWSFRSYPNLGDDFICFKTSKQFPEYMWQWEEKAGARQLKGALRDRNPWAPLEICIHRDDSFNGEFGVRISYAPASEEHIPDHQSIHSRMLSLFPDYIPYEDLGIRE